MMKSVIDDWENERENYTLLCEYLRNSLDEYIKNEGIYAKIEYRVKDSESLASKLMKDKLDNKKKGTNLTIREIYENLSDKAGLRIICRYSDEINSIVEIIKKHFEILCEDNKISCLNYNQMGYKSYHIDVKVKSGSAPPELFLKIGKLRSEIQVRTLCENVWAEIDHDIGYKPTSSVEYNIKRQIHCLGGLFEVADDSLSCIYKNLKESTIINEDFLLRLLEPDFIKFFRMEWDRDLSLKTLNYLKTIFESTSPKSLKNSLSDFFIQNQKKIIFFSEHYSHLNPENPYLRQPEILLIYYLLKKNPHSLTDLWESELFIGDLEKIGELWGISISSLLSD